MGDFGGFIGLILRGITVVSYQGSYVYVMLQFIQKLYFSKEIKSTSSGQTIQYDKLDYDFWHMWPMVPIINIFRKYLNISNKKADQYRQLAQRLDTELQIPKLLKRIQKLTALSLSLAQKNKSGGQAYYEFDEDIFSIADQYYQHYVVADHEHEKQMFNHLDSVGQIDQVFPVRPKKIGAAI